MKRKIFNAAKIIFPLITVSVIVVLLASSFFNFEKLFKHEIGNYIADDIAQLARIFENIEKTAGILGFDHQKNEIDFLNIKKDGFVGSEVGPMNLIHPKKWEGPYLAEMPRIQEEDYIVVRTKKGYFITPGDGVKLPNGKIVGKDIILDEDADIEAMLHDEEQLSYKNKPLAAKITASGQKQPFEQIILPEDGE